MADPLITDAALAAAATSPAAASSDGASATARSIDDLIKADQYAAGRAALAASNDNGGPRSGWGSVRMARAQPPGAV